MTIINPPSWLDAGAYDAREDRLTTGAFLSQHGVAGADQLAVTPGGLMTVSVSAGYGFIIRGTNGNQPNFGAYVIRNDAAVVLPISAAPTIAGQSRIDRVILRVYDSKYSGSLNEARLEVIPGTASTTPVAPAIPDHSIELATINVGNSVTSISAGAISIATRNYAQFPSTMLGGGALVPTMAVFTANGTWTNPPNCTAIRVRMAGGGGGGGGAGITTAGQVSGGSGGGAGAYSEAWYDALTLPASVAVTVGTAGAGVTGAAGTAGGDSSLGAYLTAPGGSGGNFTAASTGQAAVTPGSGGAIGTVSGAAGVPVRVAGGSGERTFIFAASNVIITGNGGGNPLATGGGAGNLNSAAGAGTGPGAGGGGAANQASQGTARAGGNGLPGVVVIEQFYS